MIDPQIKLNQKSDALIVDGKIDKIGDLDPKKIAHDKIIELDGCVAAPGFIDIHVHLREPGREDKETIETGCNSAANGGFTAVACMPNTSPAIDSAEVVNFIKNKSKNFLVDVFPIGAATIERKGEILSPMAELADAGAVAFSDDGVAIKNAKILRSAMEYAKMFDKVIIEHCEDESLAGGAMNEGVNSTILGIPPLPTIAEDLIVMRDILMAEHTNSRVHIAHISSKRAVELVRDAKRKGIKVTAEVAPHHFILTDDELKNYDTNYKMNPPLRTKEDIEAMIEGLIDGTIDAIASDHAPHTIEEKEMEFELAPNGIIGLETQLGLVLTELYHKKKLTLEQIIQKLSINPRNILGIQIPKLKEGEHANISIFDPNEIWTVDISKFKSKSINSPFGGRLLNGKPKAVINNSQMFFQNEFIKI